MSMPATTNKRRFGFSLLEAVLALTLLSSLAAAGVFYLLGPARGSKANACYALKGEIELQTQLWRRSRGQWPRADLQDIGADAKYFPAGTPVCPVDGSGYQLDPATHRVLGHSH